MKRNARRPLQLESLEARQVMAGNVTVKLVAGEVKVTGDNQGNGVWISEISPKMYRVTGLTAAGLPTTINNRASVDIYSPQDDLRVFMNGGSDVVLIGNQVGIMTVEDLTVETGDGADFLNLENLSVYDRVDTTFLRMGTETSRDGRDNVEINKATFSASVDITLGAGDDECEINATTIGNDLKINGGSGAEEIELVAVRADEIYAALGAGNDDRLELERNTARRLVADGGTGIRDKREIRAGNQFGGTSYKGFEI